MCYLSLPLLEIYLKLIILIHVGGNIMCCNQHKNTACIYKVPVFENMAQDDMEKIKTITTSQSFKKGDIIFREGDRLETLYIVNSGLIKLYKISEDGKEQIVRILFPGDFFGEFSLLQDENNYMTAEVLEPTQVCFIKKAGFLKTMENNPNLSFRFVLALNQRLHQADEWLSLLSLMEVEQRLSRAILLFYDKQRQEDFKLLLSKKDLASLIGTTPETLSRKLVSFVSQNIISMTGRRNIKILSLDKLRTIAGL